MHPCHQAARDYLAAGLHPIPCAARSKRPCVKWQDYQERQPSLSEVDAWWSTWPDANVALVLGRGTFALDADGGIDALRLLRAHGIEVPPAPTSRTANGLHILLAAPGPVPDRVALLKASPPVKAQLDVRGVGIIVAPPSIHPSGKRYEWEIPLTLPLPAAPPALLELIQTGRVKEAPHVGSSWVIEALSGVPEGQRDDTCAKLTGYFLHAGLDPATTEAVLLATFAARCSPPFSPQDVRKTVQSIARKDARNDTAETVIEPVHIGEIMKQWERSVDNGPTPTLSTPYPELNRLLGGGLRSGELVYLGARAGVGKTAFALILAIHAAESGAGVLVVSREMVNLVLIERIIAQTARVPALTVRRGTLSDAEWHAYAKARETMGRLPLWISDEAQTIEQIAAMMERFTPAHPIGLVVVDYLQMVRASRDIKERRLQVEAVSQSLKSLAVQYRLPILCMSSLSRPEKGNQDRRPVLQDLRESGELEHDADIILLMHRGFNESACELAVSKNRSGRVGVVSLRFRDEWLIFEQAPEGAE